MTSFRHITAPNPLSYYSYRSGVVSRASNSKLRHTTGRQIHGGRRGAVCVRAGIFSPGKSAIFCRYWVEPDTQMQSDNGHESHNTHCRFMLASGYAFKWFKTDLHVWSDVIQYFHKPRLIIYLLGKLERFSKHTKHTTLLGFVQLLNNVLHRCDQSNRDAAHSNWG